METFFTNSWTIGIGGGIISGLIVFLVTSKIFSKKENKEYLQKVRIANNELMYAIRPLVVEQTLPTIEIVNSILLSTAKKYNVQLSDLYKRDDIADDLTKEIMDNPFLTSENKLQYCKLTENIKLLDNTPVKNKVFTEKIVYLQKERLISKESFSLTLAVMTTLTVAVTLMFFSKDKFFSELKSDKIDLLSIIASFTIIPLIAITTTKILEIFKTKEKIKGFQNKSAKDIEKKDMEN